MDRLLTGLHHFHNRFGREREFYSKLAAGQHPSALFIGCSDSRVDPSIITQTGLGELFVMRNAGNIVPCYGASNGGEPATIEYAVAVLGVKDIIVCGHSGCGAIHAMLHPGTMESLPLVRGWLSHAEATRQIIVENYPDLTGDDQLAAAVSEHVLVQIEHLQTHPTVAVRLQRGEVTLHAWVYQMQTGEVLAYSSDDGKFTSLTSLPPEEAGQRKVSNPRQARKK
jgi:carbonic anhydrase